MPEDKTLLELLRDYTETAAAIKQEKLMRQQIEHTPEYQKLQEQIDELVEKQQAMTSRIPDSSEEHEMDRKSLLQYLNDNKITNVNGYEVKTRTSKSVNTNKVLHALDGDLDQFFLLASVTQKALTDYAKLHPELKTLFKKSIEIDTVSVTDVLPLAE